mgnify:CR=1 FL=1
MSRYSPIGGRKVHHNYSTHGILARLLRIRTGMSRKQMALLLGTNEMSIWNWEQGKNKPQPRFRKKLSALLAP